ncbi:MAG: hypothetical protein IIB44_03875 [Candidatus Marinimicrobia bacterium]|nr:hypothetical protein [Candidatus Neomarinimicrobiota bacterium]
MHSPCTASCGEARSSSGRVDATGCKPGIKPNAEGKSFDHGEAAIRRWSAVNGVYAVAGLRQT